MSIHKKISDIKCKYCKDFMVSYSLKSQYIDDYFNSCMNESCKGFVDAEKMLRSIERSNFRKEEK